MWGCVAKLLPMIPLRDVGSGLSIVRETPQNTNARNFKDLVLFSNWARWLTPNGDTPENRDSWTTILMLVSDVNTDDTQSNGKYLSRPSSQIS